MTVFPKTSSQHRIQEVNAMLIKLTVPPSMYNIMEHNNLLDFVGRVQCSSVFVRFNNSGLKRHMSCKWTGRFAFTFSDRSGLVCSVLNKSEWISYIWYYLTDPNCLDKPFNGNAYFSFISNFQIRDEVIQIWCQIAQAHKGARNSNNVSSNEDYAATNLCGSHKYHHFHQIKKLSYTSKVVVLIEQRAWFLYILKLLVR